MASSTRSRAFTFGSLVENPHTSTRGRAFNYTEYVPDSETLPDAYTYVAPAEPPALLHRLNVEVLSPHIEPSAGLHRLTIEVLSPFEEQTTRRRRPTVYLTM